MEYTDLIMSITIEFSVEDERAREYNICIRIVGELVSINPLDNGTTVCLYLSTAIAHQ